MTYFRNMGKWLTYVSVCLTVGSPGFLHADEGAWRRDMDIAAQAAVHQNYAQAEAYYNAAIKEIESANPNDPQLGPAINTLGLVYRAENKLADAERAFRRAAIYIDKANSPGSIDTANSSLNVGSVLNAEGKYNEAEPFLLRAFKNYQTLLGDRSPKTAKAMAELGEMYRNLHDNGHAEAMLKKLWISRKRRAASTIRMWPPP